MSAFDDLLRSAYDAGRRDGSYEIHVDTFEEWRAALSGLEPDDEIAVGDTVAVIKGAPVPFRGDAGQRGTVEGIETAEGKTWIVMNVIGGRDDGYRWYVPSTSLRKVQP